MCFGEMYTCIGSSEQLMIAYSISSKRSLADSNKCGYDFSPTVKYFYRPF